MKKLVYFILLTSVPGFAVSVHKPNVLLFIVDDMGYGDSKVYNPKAPVKMPHLEKLAKQGMTFTDAHTQAALCAPSRYSILSGNYPWRGRKKGGSWHFNEGSQFLKEQKSLASFLKENGYHTAMFGKVHMGALVPPKSGNNYDRRPPMSNKKNAFDWKAADFSKPLIDGMKSKGFVYSYLSYGGIQDPPYLYFENDLVVGDLQDLKIWEGGKYRDKNGVSIIQKWKPGLGMPYWKTHEVGPTLTEKTIEFIDRHHRENRGGKKPFFIQYCSQAVHVPHTPPIKFLNEKIKGTTGGTPHMDMLYEVDVALGKILDTLKKRDLLNNTLIFFTSDNGGLKQKVTKNNYNSNEGLRGHKATIWEGGHRVPMVVKWANRIRPGSKAHQMVGVHDIYATLAELIKAHPGKNQALDSKSFLSVLKGNKNEVRTHLLCQHGKLKALREGKWKLITTNKNYPLHLYNLENDLKEEKDLLNEAKQKTRMKKMMKKLNSFLSSERSTPPS